MHHHRIVPTGSPSCRRRKWSDASSLLCGLWVQQPGSGARKGERTNSSSSSSMLNFCSSTKTSYGIERSVQRREMEVLRTMRIARACCCCSGVEQITVVYAVLILSCFCGRGKRRKKRHLPRVKVTSPSRRGAELLRPGQCNELYRTTLLQEQTTSYNPQTPHSAQSSPRQSPKRLLLSLHLDLLRPNQLPPLPLRPPLSPSHRFPQHPLPSRQIQRHTARRTRKERIGERERRARRDHDGRGSTGVEDRGGEGVESGGGEDGSLGVGNGSAGTGGRHGGESGGRLERRLQA